MRNSHSTMTRSAAISGHHPQLATVDDGYDFNRARSTESTENALAMPGKAPTNSHHNPAANFCDAASCISFEDRTGPVSPKKVPPTPPRDHGSPFRGSYHPAEAMPAVQQPFLSEQPQQHQPAPHPLFRPSAWRHKEEDTHVSSVFRVSPSFEGTSPMTREHESYYTIQRSLAFDEDDDDMCEA